MDRNKNTVRVPKDLNDIRQKFIFGLTKRQVVSFGIGFILGIPTFFILKNYVGLSAGILGMGCCASPAILCGLYKKNGIYFEKYIMNMFTFLKSPRKRIYKTYNLYHSIETAIEYEKLRKILEKAEGGKHAYKK
ncbi:MAG: PrgI family protein [Oscillospiraceae bacterium]|nr:PrgI family protein [Oscillospiraceae bacterium]